MARHYRSLPVPSFSHCSWAICDIDRGQPTATRNALECANCLLRDIFEPYRSPWVVRKLGWNPLHPRILLPNQ